MGFLRSFGAFWYDFIVGDDWTVAVGVIALLAICGLLAHAGSTLLAWLLMPLGVALVLAVSLWRVRRAL
jgi:hypothetical protein